MKFAIVTLCLFAFFAKIQADTQGLNYEELSKKTADFIADSFKKLEEATGLHVDFDKAKFLELGKSVNSQLTESQKKLKEFYDANSKNLPGGEELKKKFEEFQKQSAEVMKNLNSPDVQKSAQKLQETVTTGMKKSAETLNELAEKFGLAAPPGIKKNVNEIFEEISKTMHKIQEKSAKIVEEAQAELKKKKQA